MESALSVVIKRTLKRRLYRVLSTLGSQRARGKLKVFDLTAKLRAEFAEYRGAVGARATAETLFNFFNSRYGASFELPEGFPPGRRLRYAEVEQLLTSVAQRTVSSFGYRQVEQERSSSEALHREGEARQATRVAEQRGRRAQIQRKQRELVWLHWELSQAERLYSSVNSTDPRRYDIADLKGKIAVVESELRALGA
jgi:hypothetical protein